MSSDKISVCFFMALLPWFGWAARARAEGGGDPTIDILMIAAAWFCIVLLVFGIGRGRPRSGH